MRRRAGRRPALSLKAVLAVLLALSAPMGCSRSDDPSNGDTPVDLETLTGWWVVELTPSGSAPRHGLAEATYAAGTGLVMEIRFGDGTTGALTLPEPASNVLAGTLTAPLGDVSLVPIAGGTARLEGTAGGDLLVLYRVEPFRQQDSGAWERSSNGGTAVLALDVGLGGNVALLSLLDSTGYWPEESRYKAYRSDDSPLLEDTFLTAALFNEGRSIYTCFYDWNTDTDMCDHLTRLPEESELSGVWLSGYKNYDNLTEWCYSVVVVHNQTLYVHERDESFLDSLFEWAYRAEQDGEYTYRDTDQGHFLADDWVAEVGPMYARILGRFDGWDNYYHSLERLIEPPSEYLTGDAYSISVDWFDAPMGIPEPVFGAAQILQHEDRLTITDQSNDGQTYQVEARWTGYQYEGYWFDTQAPDATSRWRGQLTASGYYLHGTWEHGEYSFALVPFGDDDIIQSAVNDASPLVTLDPYEPTAYTYNDTVNDLAVTVYRDQGRLAFKDLVDSTGEVTSYSYDEHWRVSRIQKSNHEVTLDWALDGLSVTLVEDGGMPQTLPVVISDAALTDYATEAEQVLGIDLTEYKQVLADNPDFIPSILRGDLRAPLLVPEPIRADYQKGGGLIGHVICTFVVGPMGYDKFKLCHYTMLSAELLAWGVAAAATAATLAPALIAGAAIVVGLVLAAVVIINLVNWLTGGCDPCSIICFINCPPLAFSHPPQGPQAGHSAPRGPP